MMSCLSTLNKKVQSTQGYYNIIHVIWSTDIPVVSSIFIGIEFSNFLISFWWCKSSGHNCQWLLGEKYCSVGPYFLQILQ